ncbi:MAG: hypothetical protein H7281_09735 [Bacteriovorax sp.]|nr:hypothetical protein [Bacteriovorax sp.]
MKKFNSTLLSTVYFFTLFMVMNVSYGAIPAMTTTPGAAPSSTSGIINSGPNSGANSGANSAVTTPGVGPFSTSGIINQAPALPIVVQPGSTLNSNNAPTACVDSGSQGSRCGVEAVNFCKLNPQAANCQTINNDTNIIK